VPKGRLSIRLMTQRDKNPEGYVVISYKPFLICHTHTHTRTPRCRLATDGSGRLLWPVWSYVTCLWYMEIKAMKLCKRV